MAGTQPLGNWQQEAQPAGQQPFPGAQYPGMPGPAVAGKPKRRRAWLVVAIVLVIAVGGFVAEQAINSKPKGSIALPSTLLGLPKATGTGAAKLASSLRKKEASGAGHKLSGVKAGIYGAPTGAFFAITGGGICGTCSPKSVTVIKDNLVKQQYSDARAFPAGTKGGVLACGSKSSGTSVLIRCSWVDDTTAGDVLYLGGSASGLADAAAKTNQARAVVEH